MKLILRNNVKDQSKSSYAHQDSNYCWIDEPGLSDGYMGDPTSSMCFSENTRYSNDEAVQGMID